MFTDKNKLSIEQCKKYLPKGSYADAEVEKIRDGLYQLASILVEDYLKSKERKKNGGKL